MNKYFKKFSIMFVMSLILMLGCCVSAFADDDGVVGTSNLGGTTENSAKRGDQLNAPEVGWKRYDDSNNKFNYDANWYKQTRSGMTSDSEGIVNINNSKVKFKFWGKKLRIISNIWSDRVQSIIAIDGIKYNFSEYNSSILDGSCLVYENTELKEGIHNVEIYCESGLDSNHYLVFDALDIDDTGALLPIDYDKSISLDNTTMNLTVGDTQELIATTTPASAQVTWKSSDESVAKYDKTTGKVIAVGNGSCIITATIDDGYNVITATCTVTVTPKGTEPSNPTQPNGDANLYIELVDGQIKQYSVSQDEINKFTTWYENRDKDHSLTATYKFTKGTYTDYVVHDQIDWFEVR